MTTEQRRALANTTPTTGVIRDAVTFPRDRLGEPLDISAERFDAWLARVKRDAAREALDGLAQHFDILGEGADLSDAWAWEWHAQEVTEQHRDAHYPKETTDD